jgi:hypothetical protein
VLNPPSIPPLAIIIRFMATSQPKGDALRRTATLRKLPQLLHR